MQTPEDRIYSESMTSVVLTYAESTLRWYIRVWKQSKESGPDESVIQFVRGLKTDQNRRWSLKELAKDILFSDEKINAVEVLDVNRDGIVLYKDWP